MFSIVACNNFLKIGSGDTHIYKCPYDINAYI